jgi:hypothetical protein
VKRAAEVEKENFSIYTILESKLLEINANVMRDLQSMNQILSIIMESLIRYKYRPYLIQKLLLHLSYFTPNNCELSQHYRL